MMNMQNAFERQFNIRVWNREVPMYYGNALTMSIPIPFPGRAHLTLPIFITSRRPDARRIYPFEVLQKGTHAFVVLYSTHPFSNDPTKSFVIKFNLHTGTASDGYGRSIVEKLENRVKCGQISAAHIGRANIQYIPDGKRRGTTYHAHLTAIEKMDNDLTSGGWLAAHKRLHNYSGKYADIRAIVDVVKIIHAQMICLLKADSMYLYHDLKPANVLYKLGPDEIVYRLGDLESLQPNRLNGTDTTSSYTSTYPCVDQTGIVRGFSDLPSGIGAKTACIRYQSGMLLAALMGIDINNYYYRAILNSKGISTKPLRSNMAALLPPDMYELVNLVHEDPSRRPMLACEKAFISPRRTAAV